MKFVNGKWIEFSYVNKLGYEYIHYAFINSVEEFKDIIIRYKIKFEDLINFSIEGKKYDVHQVKSWFNI